MTKSPAKRAASPEEVFCLGVSFEHSAQGIAHMMAAPHGGNFTSSTDLVNAPPGFVPLIVCMTFSVELYLKCLIWIETGKPAPRGHSLEDFYNLVTPAFQARIKHHYDLSLAPYKTNIEATKAPKHGAGSTDFLIALKTASFGFVDWRYPTRFAGRLLN